MTKFRPALELKKKTTLLPGKIWTNFNPVQQNNKSNEIANTEYARNWTNESKKQIKQIVTERRRMTSKKKRHQHGIARKSYQEVVYLPLLLLFFVISRK